MEINKAWHFHYFTTHGLAAPKIYIQCFSQWTQQDTWPASKWYEQPSSKVLSKMVGWLWYMVYKWREGFNWN